MPTGRHQASSRRSGLVFAVTDENRTVDIGENMFSRMLWASTAVTTVWFSTRQSALPGQDDQGVPQPFLLPLPPLPIPVSSAWVKVIRGAASAVARGRRTSGPSHLSWRTFWKSDPFPGAGRLFWCNSGSHPAHRCHRRWNNPLAHENPPYPTAQTSANGIRSSPEMI